ncbi:MAG TPA: addiction module protein [Burkholderiales bacterium]|nr:addiction module protein [Burkholderiales bacterium]
MATTLEKIQADAMRLSLVDRAELADRLWSSLARQDEIDRAWAEEIERRVRQLDSGEVETIPEETVIAELRAKYG